MAASLFLDSAAAPFVIALIGAHVRPLIIEPACSPPFALLASFSVIGSKSFALGVGFGHIRAAFGLAVIRIRRAVINLGLGINPYLARAATRSRLAHTAGRSHWSRAASSRSLDSARARGFLVDAAVSFARTLERCA